MGAQEELFQPLTPHKMAGRLMNKKAIQDFIFGGNATFTIRNNNTGNRFTYKIVEDKNTKYKWWVSSLRGPDLYLQIGLILGELKSFDFPWKIKHELDGAIANHHKAMLKLPKDERVMFSRKDWDKANLPLSTRSFMWFLSTYKSDKEFSDNIEIWHDGICGRCGRKLTTPESISTGYGPECIKYIHKEDRHEGLRL